MICKIFTAADLDEARDGTIEFETFGAFAGHQKLFRGGGRGGEQPDAMVMNRVHELMKRLVSLRLSAPSKGMWSTNSVS